MRIPKFIGKHLINKTLPFNLILVVVIGKSFKDVKYYLKVQE